MTVHAGHGHRGRHRRHGPLFWRIYLYGVVLLVLVGVAVAVVGWAFRASGGWGEPTGAAAYAVARVEELRGDPPRLAAELERVRASFGVRASVWDAGGALVASSAEPPLPRDAAGWPPPRKLSRLRGGHGWGYAVALADGGVLVAGSAHPTPDPLRALSVLGAVLFALAVGAIPLARSIARPIERITDAARRLGAGDLGARTGVRGRGEVGELGATFDDMAERLERLVRAEQELLANVSHELRTPMARIRVALELAAEGDLEKARRHLAGIGADLDELDQLVEDVLAAARLDVGAGGGSPWPVARAPVDVGEVAREAVERWQEQHPGREVTVDAAPAAEVEGDAALLRRLVTNLVDNGAKYSEAPAPVAVRVRAEAGGGGARGGGPRDRHRPRRPAPALHAVLPDRPQPPARHRRDRPRPRPREAHRGGARGGGRGGERRRADRVPGDAPGVVAARKSPLSPTGGEGNRDDRACRGVRGRAARSARRTRARGTGRPCRSRRCRRRRPTPSSSRAAPRARARSGATASARRRTRRR